MRSRLVLLAGAVVLAAPFAFHAGCKFAKAIYGRSLASDDAGFCKRVLIEMRRDPAFKSSLDDSLSKARSVAVVSFIPRERLQAPSGDRSRDKWGADFRMMRADTEKAKKYFRSRYSPTANYVQIYSTGANRLDEMGTGDDISDMNWIVELE